MRDRANDRPWFGRGGRWSLLALYPITWQGWVLVAAVVVVVWLLTWLFPRPGSEPHWLEGLVLAGTAAIVIVAARRTRR